MALTRAEISKLYRQRQKAERVIVPVETPIPMIEELITHGLLSEADASDRKIIGAVLVKLAATHPDLK